MTTLKNKKGVSLVELIAVIVIMGIIATVGGISVATIIDNSNTKSAETAVSDVVSAAKNYLQEKNEASVTVAQLESAGYIEPTLAAKFTYGFQINAYAETGSAKTYYVLTTVGTKATGTAEVVVSVNDGKRFVTYNAEKGTFVGAKSSTATAINNTAGTSSETGSGETGRTKS